MPSTGFDPSLVDPTKQAHDGMIIRSVGGRSGPLALENGAKLTFPWASQQRITGALPGTVVAYDDTGLGFTALSLEGSTMLAAADRAYIDLRGFNDGGSQLILGDGVANNYISINDNQIILSTAGSTLILNAGVTLNSPAGNVDITAETAIQIYNDTTNGTDITVTSNRDLILLADRNTSITSTTGTLNLVGETSISISNDATTGTTITIDSNAALNLVGVPVNVNGVDLSTSLGQWTSYSPVLGQPTEVGHTNTYARYIKQGRMVTVSVLLAITGTGNVNTDITLSLPFDAVQAGNLTVGTGHYYNASAIASQRSLPCRVIIYSATKAALQPSWSQVGGYMGNTSVFAEATANTDSIDMTFTYEATT